jgi:hypothetical protein
MTSGEAVEVVDPDLIAVGDFVMIHMRPRKPGHNVLPLHQISTVKVLESSGKKKKQL